MYIKCPGHPIRPAAALAAVLGLLALGLLALAGAGCAARFPAATDAAAAAPGPTAESLLDASIRAHGGDLWGGPAAVRVRYDGRFYTLVKLLQPVLVDAGYRRTSEERLTFAATRLEQVHEGPDGRKRVVREPGRLELSYDGEADANDERRSAAALVADAYTMFLTGPSFFRHREATLTRLPGATLDGRDYDRLSARLAPGLGFADEDRVVLWIDAATHRLDRVHFTLNGLESTRGAHVDVTFAGHRWIDGYLWPTRFLERVRGPVRLKAHRWTLVELDVLPETEPVARVATPELSNSR